MKRFLAALVLTSLLASPLLAATFTWTGDGSGNNASTSGNWLGGTAPTGVNTDEIVLDGTSGGSPDKDMTWDLTKVVGSWTQAVEYTGEVTINCLYAGDQVFTVDDLGGASGDLTINGGSWTHNDNSSTEVNRLKVAVDGDFAVGASGTIDADGAGYYGNAGPAGSYGYSYYSSHGGRGYGGLKTYGTVHSPTNIGATLSNGAGGGAIQIDVSGSSTVNGTITAKGTTGGSSRAGAGGSVWLTTGTLSGSGTVSANAGGTAYGAGGGRVAVILTNSTDFGSVTMTAYGYGSTYTHVGGAGTVYTETTGGANRTVTVDNNNQLQQIDTLQNNTTPIPPPDMPGTSTWDLDRIIVCNSGVVEVTSGTILNLSADAITNSGTGEGSVRLNGGTFNTPATLTIASNIVLIADGTNSLTCNLTIKSGASLTHSLNAAIYTEDYKMDLTVNGDLTIESGAEVNVDQKGFWSKRGPGAPTSSYGAAHGGHGLNSSVTYGSMLAPVNLGSGNDSSTGKGGGAIRLTVTGSTTLNGPISADSTSNADRTASGGSIYLTTGTLAGNGDIHADGADYSARNGGGGRVAVVITNGTFSGYSGTVSAYGGNAGTTIGAQGTIYKSDTSANQLIIDNGGDLPGGTRAADIPPNFAGNATYPASQFVFDDDLSLVDVIVQDSGRADFNGEATIMQSLTVTNAGYLVLSDGITHTVTALTIDGSNFAAGAVYSVAELQAAQVTSDISGDGSINVGMPLIENDAATNITLTSANLNGELTAKGAGTPNVNVYWGTSNEEDTLGAWAETNEFGGVTSAGPLTTNVNVSSNTVYFYRYYATNASSEAWASPTEVFLPGYIWIEGTDTNASEQTDDPGTCTVHRAAAATNGALVVNYSIGGSADGGADYEALSGVVTLLVGEATADITIDPIFNGNQSNETVILTVSNGSYLVGTSNSATVTIQAAVIPEGYNVWVGSDPTDGASWSSNRIPIASDNIMLGAYSQSDLAWSATLPDSVNSWTQEVEYVGTVTVETVYGTTGFTNFHVTGNAAILGGTWTHKKNSSTESWRLRTSVGGDLAIASGAKIHAVGLGYVNAGPAAARGASYYSSHGGRGYSGLKTYGSLNSPTNIGCSQGAGTGGGGAVLLDVAGHTTVDGTITADGNRDPGGRPTAGGSVWLTTGTLSGNGTISANADGTAYGAGGGRVAVVLTGGSDFDNISMTAYGYGDNGSRFGGAGTVYTETSGGANRTVLVDNNNHAVSPTTAGNEELTTPIPTTDMLGGSTWTVDRIIVCNSGKLEVVTGTVLNLATDSLTNNSASPGYVRLNGGTFNPPAALTLRDKTSLLVDGTNSITCNVTLASGSEISHSRNISSEIYKMNLTINGNLVVDSGGAVHADYKGFYNAGPGKPASGYGGAYGGQGQGGLNTYGSILAPVNIGSGNDAGTGGGAIKLTVTGGTTVSGTISADGFATPGARTGSGGGVYLTTATLSGGGPIRADGADYSTRNAGGGRIAVVITGGDFSSYSGTISAYGGNVGSTIGANGTIYKSDGTTHQVILDTGGTPSDVGRVTHIPANFQGDGTYPASQFVFNDDLSAVTLIVTNEAAMTLTTNIWVGDILIYTNSDIVLGSYTMFVDTAEHYIDDASLPGPGGPTNAVDSYSQIVWQGLPPGMVILLR